MGIFIFDELVVLTIWLLSVFFLVNLFRWWFGYKIMALYLIAVEFSVEGPL